MIALPVLMIAAGAVLRWALGGSSNGFTDAAGLLLIAAGTVWLAAFVVTGRYSRRREQSLPDSTRV
jgi:thiosulfate reductase cytochrome b subunit